jgi:glycosyltransferase involved in cell wall biosynthesis
VPEVVGHGVTGLLVAPGDLAGLRMAVDRLLGDEPLRADMGRAGAARCRERYAIQPIAAAYLELYGEVAGAAWVAS